MSTEEKIKERGPWYFWRNVIVVALFLAAFVYALTRINLDLTLLAKNFPSTIKLWSAFAKPDWSVLGEGVTLLIKTLYMAFMATALALPFAIVLSFLGAKNLMQSPVAKGIYTFVRGFASIIRSIQPIIWAIIFVVWVRTGPFPGVLALWIHSVADMTKLFSERVESIDVGPMEAIESTGAGKVLILIYGVVPQIINPYLSFTLYRLDINVRMATIIGIVGGGGIGMRLYSYIRKWNFPKAVVMTMLIIIMVWGIDYLSSRLRERIETGGGEKTKGFTI